MKKMELVQMEGLNGGWGSREWCLVGSILAVGGAVVAGGLLLHYLLQVLLLGH